MREATVEEGEEEEADFSADETITTQEVAEHPAVTSITGVYKIVAMGVVSVSTLITAKANEYEISIRRKGPLGLQLVRFVDVSWQEPYQKGMRLQLRYCYFACRRPRLKA